MKNKNTFIILALVFILLYFTWTSFLNFRMNLDKGDIIIYPNDGFIEIGRNLYREKIIINPVLFDWYVLFNGAFNKLKPGEYQFDSPMSLKEVVNILVKGQNNYLVIPEGYNLFQIETLLKTNNILSDNDSILSYKVTDFQGVFEKYPFLRIAPLDASLEGFLFPDSYIFLKNTPSRDIILAMLDNFNYKVANQFTADDNFYRNLIIASILEKEIPDVGERKIAADILLRRLKSGIPLGADATLCYLKTLYYQKNVACYPINSQLKNNESPYNTYKYRGLPPTPICNPGLRSIEAAFNPEPNEFWYYLSDPLTQNTIFSKTLEEHNKNIQKYLR